MWAVAACEGQKDGEKRCRYGIKSVTLPCFRAEKEGQKGLATGLGCMESFAGMRFKLLL